MGYRFNVFDAIIIKNQNSGNLNGLITKAVNIEVDHASKSAKKAVESAGGKVTVLGKKG